MFSLNSNFALCLKYKITALITLKCPKMTKINNKLVAEYHHHNFFFIITAYSLCGKECLTCVTNNSSRITDTWNKSQEVVSVEQTVFDNLLFSLYAQLIDILFGNLKPIWNMSLSAVAEIKYNTSKYLLYINMALFPCLKSLCNALLLTEQH